MSREYEKAIAAEVEDHWPGVAVEFVKGGKHPKAKFTFGGKILARPYSGTPSDGHFGIHRMLGDMRRAMRQLGAERSKPDPTDEEVEKAYKKKQAAAPKLPTASREIIKTGPSMPEQLEKVAKEAGIQLPAIQTDIESPKESTKLLMPKIELRLGHGAYDLLPEEYHGDPAAEASLSASLGKVMIDRTPRHGWEKHPRLNPHFEADDLMKFRVGSAFHSELLGKGTPIAEFAHKEWRTNAAKADRDAALADGYTPLTVDQAAKVKLMVSRARYQIKGRDELAYAMAGGHPERVYIWIEETKFGPIHCRMMVDWTPHAGRYFVDWKTTGVGALNDWGNKTMWDTGCDIQDAFYRRGFKAHGMDFDACLFAVIEDSEPHGLMTHRIDPEAQDEADQEVQWAINNFAMCMHSGHWPMYPLQMAWQIKPAWRVNRHAERKAMGQGQVDQENLAAYMQMLADTRAENDARAPILNGDPDDPFGLPKIEKGNEQ